jgi:type III pantothenate kinase
MLQLLGSFSILRSKIRAARVSKRVNAIRTHSLTVVARIPDEAQLMILCLDVGNSQLFGGVFDGDTIQLRFRHDTKLSGSSDDLGLFLKNVLRENGVDNKKIKKIAICSVVPNIDYSLRAACIKYFDIEPFVLQAGVKTGLKITTRNPLEVGADLITNALAATQLYPKQNIIVVGLGTATTICAISAAKEYLGCVITAGIRITMSALQSNTAKLFPVEILSPENVIGRSTLESIQSGLYYGQLGLIRETVNRITQQTFAGQSPIVIGTGGFSHLFEKEKVFTTVIPDLVLQGLRLALEMNSDH